MAGEMSCRTDVSKAETDISIAISGYAGLKRVEDGTPAGIVWFAEFPRTDTTKRECFSGDCRRTSKRYVLALNKCID